jgi:hypothetical protein
MFEVAEAYEQGMGGGDASWHLYSWSLLAFGMAKTCSMRGMHQKIIGELNLLCDMPIALRRTRRCHKRF